MAVVYNDKVVFLRGYGVRKIGEPAQIDPDTVFELASVSKPIASTILASLAGEGKSVWDDRIADLDPQFQLSSAETTQQVTIRDFLLAPQRPGHALWRHAGRARLLATADSSIACAISQFQVNLAKVMPTAISASPLPPLPLP